MQMQGDETQETRCTKTTRRKKYPTTAVHALNERVKLTEGIGAVGGSRECRCSGVVLIDSGKLHVLGGYTR